MKLTLYYVSTITLTLARYSAAWTPSSHRLATVSPHLHLHLHLHSNSNSNSNSNSKQPKRYTILKERDGENDEDTIVFDHSLPNDENVWKSEGERLILDAALGVAGTLISKDDIDIQWKSGKIIVTVANSILNGSKSTDEDDEDDEDEDLEIEYDDADEDYENSLEDEESESSEDVSDKADVVSIARAINYAFGEEGEGSLGYSIAVHHEIEVTTPEASDELEGVMFEAYKGFTVIVETLDPKKKDGKVKIVEGNLVERTEDFLILNTKGRRRKLKNQIVKSVKLPKAKREKGVK